MILAGEHPQFRIRKHMSILSEDTIHLPVVERKALGFVKMLDEMPKFILDGELIVGSRTLFNPRQAEVEDGLSKNLDFVPDAENLAVESPAFEFYPHYLSRLVSLNYFIEFTHSGDNPAYLGVSGNFQDFSLWIV